jgi:nicotinamidase-related amidase
LIIDFFGLFFDIETFEKRRVVVKQFKNIFIYETLREIVEPSHTCLVVWDVQNALVENIFNKEAFISTLSNFIEQFRSKMPIFYTLITPPKDEFRSSWQYYSMMKSRNVTDPTKVLNFMRDPKDRSIYKAFYPKESDIILEKPTASIFIGTNFEYLIRSRNINTIIFTGIATHIGIESCARDASNRGFYPVVISDCVSSSDEKAHNCSLENMSKLFIVESSNEILKALA